MAEDPTAGGDEALLLRKLLGGIGHDLNNSWAVVLGNLQLYSGRQEQTDPLIDLALRAARKGALLSSRLLSIAGRRSARNRVLDPVRWLNSHRIELQDRLGEPWALTLIFAQDLPNFKADPQLLLDVLDALLSNAKEAMTGGGAVEIQLWAESGREEGIEILHWVIRDQGCGMDVPLLAQACEPFFSSRSNGLGLGLAASRALVELMEGALLIESQPDQGTTVRLSFPASREEADPAIDVEPVLPRGRGERILLVEDNLEFRQFAIQLLGNLGYQTMSASSAHSALSIMDDEACPPIDLVLTDVLLTRGLNGVQLVQQLRGRGHKLRALFMSGFTEQAFDEFSVDIGEDLLRKPFSTEDLARRLRAKLATSPE